MGRDSCCLSEAFGRVWAGEGEEEVEQVQGVAGAVESRGRRGRRRREREVEGVIWA
jgi:hypothetical protein